MDGDVQDGRWAAQLEGFLRSRRRTCWCLGLGVWWEEGKMWRDWEDIWGYDRQDLVMDAWGQEKSRMAACARLVRQLTETCHTGRCLVQRIKGLRCL